MGPREGRRPQAPFNPVTGRRYHGINVLILGMDLRAFQSGNPRWMTYQQVQENTGRCACPADHGYGPRLPSVLCGRGPA